jgi:four helix bundle protein
MKYQTELRNKNRGYMKLIVWQRAMDLFGLVWQLSYKEASIDFKLRSQLADAAQSISANISEGYGRRSINEYIQFLYYALGSMAETMTRAVGLKQTNDIFAAGFEDFNALHYEVENRLLRLVEKLEQKRDAGEWTTHIAEEAMDEPDLALMLAHSITPSLHYSTTPSLLAHA